MPRDGEDGGRGPAPGLRRLAAFSLQGFARRPQAQGSERQERYGQDGRADECRALAGAEPAVVDADGGDGDDEGRTGGAVPAARRRQMNLAAWSAAHRANGSGGRPST
ncbi:hypothetical protein, partial [Streptomyces sp. NPDC005877]|uniref:hypothetical protein n=1 Tax=Streptomyces sp. NPDC005877 TaxID=3155346 RepID=UPI0033CCABF8